ncbi:MAG: carbohydrate ABC transporter permease [Propioniciclava sp.]|uniref:carbohydrate ABC transporter permease n=1 Tax=Propioniciclava sp. TaxID=2038686 RepID=UPI0039E435CB
MSRRRTSPTAVYIHPLVWVLIALVMIGSLVPVYWLVNTSLKSGAGLSSADLWPASPTFQNYVEVINTPKFGFAVRNSIIVSVSVTSLALLFGASAAYALARLPLSRKGFLLTMVMSISTFPVIAIAAPIFNLWSLIGIYDTLLGLIIPKLTFALPLAIFTLTSFFREIPMELEEAASIDGASAWRTFWQVILPVAMPGIATTAILVFISSWNEFLLPATLSSTINAQTIPVAIAMFSGANEYDMPIGTISAASVIVTLPLLIVVMVFQKQIVSGLTSGAVKG